MNKRQRKKKAKRHVYGNCTVTTATFTMKPTISTVYVTIAEISGGLLPKIELNPDPPITECHEIAQHLLRAAGNHSCEYVWSDVLGAHVRIGE